MHLGQHRNLGWGDISGKVVELEIQAQEKLLGLGSRLGWSSDSMDTINRALEYWRSKSQ